MSQIQNNPFLLNTSKPSSPSLTVVLICLCDSGHVIGESTCNVQLVFRLLLKEYIWIRLTTPATMSANTLGSVHGEATRSALAGASAASISSNVALSSGDSAGAGSGRRSGSRRSGSGRCLSGRRGSGSRRSATSTGDGSSRASAVLSNGHLLEYGLGLSSGRVDGENHSHTAVASLSAVEPLEEVSFLPFRP